MNAGFESLRGRAASIHLDPLCSLPSTMLWALEGRPLSLAPVPLTSCWTHPGRQGHKISGQDGKRLEYSSCWARGRLWLWPSVPSLSPH